jgi:hypothetical protein
VSGPWRLRPLLSRRRNSWRRRCAQLLLRLLLQLLLLLLWGCMLCALTGSRCH